MDKEGSGCVFLFFSAISLAILLIIDSVLLFGSIKQNIVALIVGIVFDALAILIIIVITVLHCSILAFSSMMWKFITLTSLTAIGFKLWTFLTVVGVLQELMLEIEPETSMRMSDLQP